MHARQRMCFAHGHSALAHVGVERRKLSGRWAPAHAQNTPHTEDNANVELVPWRSEKVVTSLVERYRPPRCRKVQEKKRNSCESRYLAFGQGWLKGAQDWLKWWDKDGKFVRKDFRRWLAAEKGGRRLKMKSRRDIAAANKAGWAGLYCRCAENSECGCGACE